MPVKQLAKLGELGRGELGRGATTKENRGWRDRPQLPNPHLKLALKRGEVALRLLFATGLTVEVAVAALAHAKGDVDVKRLHGLIVLGKRRDCVGQKPAFVRQNANGAAQCAAPMQLNMGQSMPLRQP